MNYWLVKSEPNTWSWDDQLRDKRTFWDGVRNYQASNNMKKMKKGDLSLFYHSGKDREVVGIVRIVKEYYPDHTDKTGKFGMVDVEAMATLPQPVPLKDIKAESSLRDIALVKQPRLSVMPIPKAAFELICGMGGVQNPDAL